MTKLLNQFLEINYLICLSLSHNLSKSCSISGKKLPDGNIGIKENKIYSEDEGTTKFFDLTKFYNLSERTNYKYYKG